MLLSIETEQGIMNYNMVNVLYIPKLLDTLLSIGEITHEGNKATFKKDAVRVELKEGSFSVE